MRALLVVAPADFRDEEFFESSEELEKAGVDVVVASSRKGRCFGSKGGSVEAVISVSDADVRDYDAVVFIGGSGAEIFFGDRKALSLAESAFSSGRVVGAICIAPVILARAGIVKGLTVAAWGGASGEVKRAGAVYTSESVFVDGRVVTANGPSASREFGRRIAGLLR